LIPDARHDSPQDAQDYYRQRYLLPPAYRAALGELAHRLIVTNYHEFLPRQLSGNKKTPFDGKLDEDGNKVKSCEDENLVLRRVLGSFKPGRRLLVINDEAHHCYLPLAKGKDTELDNSETENERAAVWFSGIRAVAQRFKLRAVYDLSATPYFLSGSGYPAYSLFPWTVSDFGLIEAIESGLVKIPFLPVDDSSHAIDEPILKNLYENCKGELPKKVSARLARMPTTMRSNSRLRRICPVSSVQPSSSSITTTKNTSAASARRAKSRPTCSPRRQSSSSSVTTPRCRARFSRKSPATSALTKTARHPS
jgi:type III restriction enzyme